MTRRILLLLAAVLVAVTAAADTRGRDMLLTSDGTLYTVETKNNPEARGGVSNWYLTLTVQNGESRTSETVPATLTGGAHSNPALGYDAESNTLFLFWQQTENGGLSSRLLFASYQDGTWSEATTLDSVDWDLRRNLKIAVTRYAELIHNGTRTSVPQITVHAVWWQESGNGEWARYAMLTIDRGVVTDIQIRSLAEFAGLTLEKTPLRELSPHEVLRHPAALPTSGGDSVDVIFGDTQSDSMYHVRLKPTNEGRLRIPIGVKPVNVGRPQFDVAPTSNVEAVATEGSFAMYTVEKGSLSFVLNKNGAWSSVRKLGLADGLEPEAAVDALKKMVAAQ